MKMPSGATDTHFHIYLESVPPAPGGPALPGHYPVAEYQKVQQRLGLTRAIVAQPNAYQDDNGLTLQSIKELGPQARGVGVVKPGVSDAALLFQESPFYLRERKRIAEWAVRQGWVTAFPYRAHVEAGGLLSYDVNTDALRRRAAAYVDKILKGARPGDLPVEQPREFELVINLKTAQALGIRIPPRLLLQATEVIRLTPSCNL